MKMESKNRFADYFADIVKKITKNMAKGCPYSVTL
jgi:hypothetical protein